MANCGEQGSSESTADFEARIAQMATGAYSVMSMALGSRLRLFHLMSRMEEPFTPKELADAGNFKERFGHLAKRISSLWIGGKGFLSN